MTLATCAVFILLAFVAAVFAQAPKDFVLPSDRELYVNPFFRSEGFYRSFLINLSFAGISTAATGAHFNNHQTFWVFLDPTLALVLNLVVGLMASLLLLADSEPLRTQMRGKLVIGLVSIGFFAFIFSVASIDNSSTPQSPSKSLKQDNGLQDGTDAQRG